MNSNSGSLALVGCILIGTGIGMVFDEAGVGAIIGTGIGFLVMAIFNRKR
ncbi:MAG TPA: hypothetical protein VK119_03585 [Bacillota bacterium]|nr:hypothetical protein [Bacillota bacterium]